ncbi:hypothetical protein, partial [Bifidobacterium catulorum]|uniref:hypothetical protein n=1 Tax=Bifidobacterium catulorum TaxID=1630173 RepID=UPI0019D47599
SHQLAIKNNSVVQNTLLSSQTTTTPHRTIPTKQNHPRRAARSKHTRTQTTTQTNTTKQRQKR